MSQSPLDRDMLCQRWLHSHEEDTESEMVFRPAEFTFPPARGRWGFELRGDRSCLLLGPGPTDRPEETAGQWDVAGETSPQLRMDCGGSSQQLEVVTVEKDRLVVKKPT